MLPPTSPSLFTRELCAETRNSSGQSQTWIVVVVVDVEVLVVVLVLLDVVELVEVDVDVVEDVDEDVDVLVEELVVLEVDVDVDDVELVVELVLVEVDVDVDDVELVVELVLVEVDVDVDDVDVEVEVLVDVLLLVEVEVLDEVVVVVLELLEVDVLLDVELLVDVEVDVEVVLDVEVDVELVLEVLVVVDDVVEVVVVGTGSPNTSRMSPLHFATVEGTASSGPVQVPPALLSQLTIVPSSTCPSLSGSVHRIVIGPNSRNVDTPCAMSPHASPSKFAYGPTPLFTSTAGSGGERAGPRYSCAQFPVKALPPSSATNSPMSQRWLAPATSSARRLSVAKSPGPVQGSVTLPGTTLMEPTRTSSAVQLLLVPVTSLTQVWAEAPCARTISEIASVPAATGRNLRFFAYLVSARMS